MQEAVIAINGQLREIFRGFEWFDPDRFSLRLSREIAARLEVGLHLDSAITAALEATPTDFYRSNRGAKSRLPDLILEALERHGVQSFGLLDVIRRFKSFAERQLVADLRKTQGEDVGRSHLQTYLDNLGRSFREVPVGAGRSDILLILPDSEEIIETKIWKGKRYHDDGVAELIEYMKGQALTLGYYVVFEFHAAEPATPEEETVSDGDLALDVVYIHVPRTSPSKIARARRHAKTDRNTKL